MTFISKLDNSLGLRIPKEITQKLHLNEGSTISLDIEDGKILITLLTHRKKYTLDELLEGMTEDKFHEEIDTGFPVGQEEW